VFPARFQGFPAIEVGYLRASCETPGSFLSDTHASDSEGDDRPTRTTASPLLVAGSIGLVALALGAALLAPESITASARLAWSSLQSAPAPIYFAVMSIALLAPVPASVLYLTAGPLYGILPSLLWIAPALAINALLVHVIASSLLRPRLERLVARRGLKIPALETHADENLFIVLVRITPGIPYFVQSWLLGLAGVRRAPFVLITVAIQMLYATGFVVLGRSAFEGDAAIAIAALAALVVVSLGARQIHKRFRANVHVAPTTSDGAESDAADDPLPEAERG